MIVTMLSAKLPDALQVRWLHQSAVPDLQSSILRMRRSDPAIWVETRDSPTLRPVENTAGILFSVAKVKKVKSSLKEQPSSYLKICFTDPLPFTDLSPLHL